VLVKRYLAPSEFTAEENWRLVEWCRDLFADEFAIDGLGTEGGGFPESRIVAQDWMSERYRYPL
jgi:hypothetical protein